MPLTYQGLGGIMSTPLRRCRCRRRRRCWCPLTFWFLLNNLRIVHLFDLKFFFGGCSLWVEGSFRWWLPLDIQDGYYGSHFEFGFRQMTWEPFTRLTWNFFWWLLSMSGRFLSMMAATGHPRWQLWQPSWICSPTYSYRSGAYATLCVALVVIMRSVLIEIYKEFEISKSWE